MYGSTSFAKDNNVPVAVTKSGETYSGGSRLSTMDAMQLITKYCIPLGGYTMKENADCPSLDKAGISRKVFHSRFCDGTDDCNGGEDEDGTMGRCIDAHPPTEPNGCCSSLVLNGHICTHVGEYNSKDTYQCSGNSNHVVYYRKGTNRVLEFGVTKGIFLGPLQNIFCSPKYIISDQIPHW